MKKEELEKLRDRAKAALDDAERLLKKAEIEDLTRRVSDVEKETGGGKPQTLGQKIGDEIKKGLKELLVGPQKKKEEGEE